ncbi:hypothetical protein Emed_002307 [Eimeria media]
MAQSSDLHAASVGTSPFLDATAPSRAPLGAAVSSGEEGALYIQRENVDAEAPGIEGRQQKKKESWSPSKPVGAAVIALLLAGLVASLGATSRLILSKSREGEVPPPVAEPPTEPPTQPEPPAEGEPFVWPAPPSEAEAALPEQPSEVEEPKPEAADKKEMLITQPSDGGLTQQIREAVEDTDEESEEPTEEEAEKAEDIKVPERPAEEERPAVEPVAPEVTERGPGELPARRESVGSLSSDSVGEGFEQEDLYEDEEVGDADYWMENDFYEMSDSEDEEIMQGINKLQNMLVQDQLLQDAADILTKLPLDKTIKEAAGLIVSETLEETEETPVAPETVIEPLISRLKETPFEKPKPPTEEQIRALEEGLKGEDEDAQVVIGFTPVIKEDIRRFLKGHMTAIQLLDGYSTMLDDHFQQGMRLELNEPVKVLNASTLFFKWMQYTSTGTFDAFPQRVVDMCAHAKKLIFAMPAPLGPPTNGKFAFPTGHYIVVVIDRELGSISVVDSFPQRRKSYYEVIGKFLKEVASQIGRYSGQGEFQLSPFMPEPGFAIQAEAHAGGLRLGPEFSNACAIMCMENLIAIGEGRKPNFDIRDVMNLRTRVARELLFGLDNRYLQDGSQRPALDVVAL